MKVVNHPAIWLLCLTTLTTFTTCLGGEKAADVKVYIAKMTEAKTLSESYVGIAKDHLDPKSDDYLEAQKKYALAYSKYSAWLATLEAAVQDGSSRKLDEDASFQREGEDAGSAAGDFVTFVDQHTVQSKAVITIFTDLATAGLKIWQGVKAQQKADRLNIVTNLESHAKWKSWSELTTAPNKP